VTGPIPGAARAITSLAQTEEKLRKALGLVSDVGLAFHPEAFTPIVVAADATAIGNASYRGRRFAGSVLIAGGAAETRGFKATDAIVIERIVSMTTTGSLQWTTRVAAALTADSFAMTTTFAPWTERPASDTDFAPVGSGSTAAFVASGALISQGNTINGAQTEYLYGPVLLLPGMKLYVTTSGALVNGSISIYGYVF
jgi:hypothetical protein